FLSREHAGTLPGTVPGSRERGAPRALPDGSAEPGPHAHRGGGAPARPVRRGSRGVVARDPDPARKPGRLALPLQGASGEATARRPPAVAGVIDATARDA